MQQSLRCRNWQTPTTNWLFCAWNCQKSHRFYLRLADFFTRVTDYVTCSLVMYRQTAPSVGTMRPSWGGLDNPLAPLKPRVEFSVFGQKSRLLPFGKLWYGRLACPNSHEMIILLRYCCCFHSLEAIYWLIVAMDYSGQQRTHNVLRQVPWESLAARCDPLLSVAIISSDDPTAQLTCANG